MEVRWRGREAAAARIVHYIESFIDITILKAFMYQISHVLHIARKQDQPPRFTPAIATHAPPQIATLIVL